MKRGLAIVIVCILSVGFLGVRGIDARGVGDEEGLIMVGVGAYRDGFFDIAEQQFSQFVRDYPNHGKVYDVAYLLGKTHLNRGKLKEAEKIFSKVVHEGKNFEDRDYALFWLAQIGVSLGRGTEAYRLLLSLIRQFPKFEWIDQCYYLVGILDLKANKVLEAEASFKKVVLVTKRVELIQSAWFWLGILSYKQNKDEAAVAYFKKMWEESRPMQESYLKYALFWMGGSQLKLGRFQEAKLSYKAFCEQFPNDSLVAEGYWRLGVCEYRSGNIQDAIEVFQSFRKRFKDPLLILYTHYLMGEIFLTTGDYTSSIKEFKVLFEQSKEMSLWGVSALALFWNYAHLGETEEANRIFQRLQKLNSLEEEKMLIQWLNAEIIFSEERIADALPYYFNILNTRFRERALFRIGKGYFLEKKFREAVTNLDILLLEFPNSQHLEEPLFIKGECLVQMGNSDQALEAFNLMVQQNGNRPWQPLALTQLAMIYLSREEDDKAEAVFKRLIHEFPEHPLSYHAALQLGNLYFKRKDIVEAVSHYSMVLRGNILDLLGEASFGLGEIFYQEGKYEKALASFEAAISHLKVDSLWFCLTQLEMGNLQKNRGKYEEAKKSYRTVLDHSKDEEMRKAAKELLDQVISN